MTTAPGDSRLFELFCDGQEYVRLAKQEGLAYVTSSSEGPKNYGDAADRPNAERLPKVGVPFFSTLGAFYLFFSYYPDWAGISSYGNRFFISVTALFIVGLAYLLERIAIPLKSPRATLAVSTGILACFALWNLGLIYQWGAHLVPARGPISFREAAHNQFFVVPAQISSQLRSYLFRRSDTMQQIEHQDLEQLKSVPER